MMIDLEKIGNLLKRKITRRQFLRKCLDAGIGMTVSCYLIDIFSRYKAFASIGEKNGMKEALFYEKMGGDAVRCTLCPNRCLLSDGQRGFCRVREPVGGKLYTLVYELICSVHIDPIEKKPLFHVLPGTKAFSVATAGCNSRCKFCQNWTISQRPPEETTNRRLSCRNLVESAVANGCSSIAYTYSEPVVFYEYVRDSSILARGRGIKNIIVTGGKINQAPLKEWCSHVDAANVDLKGFNEEYMREVCAQDLKNILETIVTLRQEKVWVELTNLIVPTLNDKMEEIRRMVKWIKKEIGPDVPLHFSRFWPQYKLRSLYPTPVDTLQKAREIAIEEGLHYVYIGNVPQAGFESTVCPNCNAEVISRIGYNVTSNNLINGECGTCGHKIPGIWN